MNKRMAKVSLAEDGNRIDQALVKLMPDLSRKAIKAMLDAGGVYRNKRRVERAGSAVSLGDVLEVYWQDGCIPGRCPRLDRSLVSVETDAMVVINKPAGMPSQAVLEGTAGTVIEAVKRDLGLAPVFLAHRLDKETSGLIVLARTAGARDALEKLFRDRIVKKTYLALVAGIPARSSGSIDVAIEPDRSAKNRYRIASTAAGAGARSGGAVAPRSSQRGRQVKSACTDYKVLAVSEASGSPVALMAFFPMTGRTHQIRVHSAQVLGFPILGDKTYGAQLFGHAMHGRDPVLRHMLHAWKLKFPDPETGVWWELTAPPPADFLDCLKAAGIPSEALALLDGELSAAAPTPGPSD